MLLSHPHSQLNLIPEQPGVYQFFDSNNKLLYIGKAKYLNKRVKSYFEGKDHGPHIKKMAEQINSLEIIITPSEVEALILEQRLIHDKKPKYNIIFRDDKTYTYISITKHKTPQIKLYRGQRNDQENIFGPYTDSKSAKAKIDLIQKTFKIRTCDDSTFSNRTRPCVLHQIGRCSAPCIPNLYDFESYERNIKYSKNFLAGKSTTLLDELTLQMEKESDLLNFESAAEIRDQIRLLSQTTEYQNIVTNKNYHADIIGVVFGEKYCAIHLLRIIDGNVSEVSQYLVPFKLDATSTLNEFLSSHYNTLAPLKKILLHIEGAQIQADFSFIEQRWAMTIELVTKTNSAESGWISHAISNAKLSLNSKEKPYFRNEEQEKRFLMTFPNFPNATLNHIECFDISHFMGESAVGSCVVYKDHLMRPELYKIFNIHKDNAGDDFSSMKEVLIRNYQTKNASELPQLIIIDGGLGQVNKAQEALSLIHLKIPMIGIAKGITRKLGHEEIINTWNDPSFHFDKTDPLLLFLSHIRDESHRFAITKNRKKISEKRMTSVLNTIPGIGPAKRKALLLAFGSTKNIANASCDQISKVKGISKELAQIIKNKCSF